MSRRARAPSGPTPSPVSRARARCTCASATERRGRRAAHLRAAAVLRGFLRGRDFREAPDLTSRICGICPIAYQTSAMNAIEDACGVVVDGPLRELRRLLYCGEWIESHALHVLMLHAPDFLGYESGIALARDHPDLVEAGLRLKKAGNRLVAVIGGREIHPVNTRVGGFYRAPTRRELATLREELERGRETALELTRWASGFTFPDFEQDYEFVALCPPRGLCDRTRTHRLERGPRHRRPRVRRARRGGARARTPTRCTPGCARAALPRRPVARFVLNGDRLSPLAREAAAGAGLDARPAATRSAASWRGASSSSTPATRRCG